MADACKRVRNGPMPATSKTSTASLMPRIFTGPSGFKRKISGDDSLGILADDDRAGRRDRLQARGEICGVADGRVLGVARAGLNRAHNDFAGIDANANFDWRATLGAQPRPVIAQLILHAQSRVERPLRMVLVGDRRAEQREDAVAGRLHDVAVEVLHRLDHQAQRGIDERLRFFRVDVLHQLGRTLDIGEERGDRLAFAGDDVHAWMAPSGSSERPRAAAKRGGCLSALCARIAVASHDRGAARFGCAGDGC